MFLTAIYIGIWPALEYYEKNYLKDPTLSFTHYYFVMYLLVFNGLLLLCGGRYIASVMAYPYQSCFLSRHLARTTNQRMGEEFQRCVERLTDVMENMAVLSSDDTISNILLGFGGNSTANSPN
jgi:hypothetical protein